MLKRNPDYTLREIAGETVILPIAGEALRTSALYAANPIGLEILRFLAEPKTRQELLAHLCARYEVAEAQAADDLSEYLAQLLEKKILLETP